MNIFICGDIAIANKTIDFISPELKSIISSADISICNAEAPIASRGSKIPKVGPHIFQNQNAISIMKNAGFDVATLANNHIYDYGEIGLLDTIKAIKCNSMLSVGAGQNFNDAYKLLKIIKNETIIGILSFCEGEFGCLTENKNKGGYAWINHPSVNNIVKTSRQEVDILIIAVHAGEEEVPLPLPEWRIRYKELCDMGVDVVAGHHPHIPQGIEQYNNSLILYSLGNFYFDVGSFKNKTNHSFSILLDINNKKITNHTLIYHQCINSKICIIHDKEFIQYIDLLTSYLSDDSLYNKVIKEQSLHLYKTRHQNYYCSFAQDPNNRSKQLLLLHNLRIESHRLTSQRALSLIGEDNYHSEPLLFNNLLNQNKWYKS